MPPSAFVRGCMLSHHRDEIRTMRSNEFYKNTVCKTEGLTGEVLILHEILISHSGYAGAKSIMHLVGNETAESPLRKPISKMFGPKCAYFNQLNSVVRQMIDRDDHARMLFLAYGNMYMVDSHMTTMDEQEAVQRVVTAFLNGNRAFVQAMAAEAAKAAKAAKADEAAEAAEADEA